MSTKKPNAYTKRSHVQARLSVAEMRKVVEKAVMYAQGNVSAFVRLAVINYRPTKKVER